MRKRRARKRREILVVAEPRKMAVLHCKEGQVAFVNPGGLYQVYREDEPDHEEDVLLKLVRLLMGRDPNPPPPPPPRDVTTTTGIVDPFWWEREKQ